MKIISEISFISILKVYKDVDLEFLVFVVEFLFNMLFIGDNLNLYGVFESLSRFLDLNFEVLKMINNDFLDFLKLGLV